MKGQILTSVRTVNNKTGNVKLTGLSYETTAQALETMTQEQQAQLYTQGYRTIIATYNDTITTHVLKEDGSLIWGGHIPKNLLVNPNFAIAQAGYGGYHGTQMFAADMWKTKLLSSVSVSGHEMTVVTSDAYGGIEQYIRVENLLDAEFYTFAALCKNGGSSDTFLNVGLNKDSGEWGNVGGKWFANSSTDFSMAVYNFTRDQISGWDMICAVIQSVDAGSLIISHPVLLPGSYTKKTLPPWVDPDPVTELMKCRTYFKQFNALPQKYGYKFSVGMSNAAANTVYFPIMLSPPMRAGVSPSIYVNGNDLNLYNGSFFGVSNMYVYDFDSNNEGVGVIDVGCIPQNNDIEGGAPYMIILKPGASLQISSDL